MNQAEVEDVEEEDDCRWYQLIVRRKSKRSGKRVPTDTFHESGVDLSEVGLRGSLKQANFGWNVQHIPDSEKEGFRVRQQISINHYAWFRKSHPSRFWLLS